jgi:hypothetical protein
MSQNEDDERKEKFPQKGDALLIKGPIEEIQREQREAKKRDEEYKSRQVRYNKIVAWFTGGLLLTSIMVVVIYHEMAETMSRQLDEMQRSSVQTSQLIVNAAHQASETHDLAVAARKQANQASIQAQAAQVSADAAKSAADTAKSALTTSQGAYVTIGRKDGVVAEFVVSKDHPDDNVPLVVYFQNTGHIPAEVAWDTTDRKDGKLAPLGIHLFSTGTGRTPLPPGMLGKNGEFYEAVGEVIAGESVGRNELAYISRSDLEELSKRIVGFYIDGYYAYCDQLGTWSTHQFTLNYHSDIPIDLRFVLISDVEIANTPIPKSTGGKSFFPPCTSTVVMSQTQQYANRKAN